MQVLNKPSQLKTQVNSMSFTKDAGIDGTSLKGHITVTYNSLVKVFGQPDSFGGDKTTVEWRLLFANGTVATIYDWKEITSPKDHPDDKYEWHIGGKNIDAMQQVVDAYYFNVIKVGA